MKKVVSWVDKFCKELPKEEQPLCYQLASDFRELLSDLKKKDYLRSGLMLKKGEEERANSEYILENLRKVTDAFNKFDKMYVDKERQKKFIELNKPYGMTKTDLNYLLYSESVFVFLQNIEAFRAFLLFVMKLPIYVKGRRMIHRKTTLGELLKRLKKLGIKKVDALSDIDYKLRNGLSHGLFWLHEQGDSEHSKPHLHYSTDITFKNIKLITFADLLSKMRKQAIYTICLIYTIGEWFR